MQYSTGKYWYYQKTQFAHTKSEVILMCGRYSLFTDEENREIMEIIQEISRKYPDTNVKTGEIRPTNIAPVLLQEGGRIQADIAGWGFPKFTDKGVIINARAETALDKPTFRKSIETRRCVVPSTGFYEWSQDTAHQKYIFRLPESRTLYMAGIYNEFKGERRFVILTAEGNASIRDIHNRMPVVLRPEMVDDWIINKDKVLPILTEELPQLVRQLA